MAFLRFALIILVVQTVVYASVYFYLRELRRERLIEEYQDGATAREREAFVQATLATYCARMSRRLALLVYPIPLACLGVFIYVTNRG